VSSVKYKRERCEMVKKASLISLFIILTVSFANAYDLATEISNNNGKVILSSVGYAKLGLIRINTRSKGRIALNGTLSVKGIANIVMWAKVEGNYYFSKLPNLQNMSNQKNVKFAIPFNAADKTVTEIILQVELKDGGSIEVNNIRFIKG
jgi:hypothetical protein